MSSKPGVTVNYNYGNGYRGVAKPKRRQRKKGTKQANMLYTNYSIQLLKLSCVGITNICRFYNSSKGCRKSSCQFLHISQEELDQRVRSYKGSSTKVCFYVDWHIHCILTTDGDY